MTRRTVGRAVAVVLTAALIGVFASVAGAPAATPAYRVSETYIRAPDGILLHASVFRPPGVARGPVIVNFTPYDNTGGSISAGLGGVPLTPTNTAPPAPDGGLTTAGMFGAGYTYVQVALRGTGGSQGCWDDWGPATQADTTSTIEWATRQPWSDGRVVMWGASAGAISELTAIAGHPKGLVAAVVIQAPIGSAEVWTGGVLNSVEGVAWGPAWLLNTLIPPSLASDGQYWSNALTRKVLDPACPLVQAADPFFSPSSTYWRDRDRVLSAVRASTLPVLWVGGFHDWNAREDPFLALFNSLRGPHRGYFGQWWHGPSAASSGTTMAAIALNWYQHFVAGAPLLPGAPAEVQDITGTWRPQPAWPATDVAWSTIPVRPATIVGTAANNEESVSPVGGSNLPTGRGAWSLTAPLRGPVTVSGFPTLDVTVSSAVTGSNLIALVYDVRPDGSATFVDRGAALLGGPGPVHLTLAAQDWRFAAGHRVGVLLTGDDIFWFNPGNPLPVSVSGGSLRLPVRPCAPMTAAPGAVPNYKPRSLPPPIVIPAATLATASVPGAPACAH